MVNGGIEDSYGEMAKRELVNRRIENSKIAKPSFNNKRLHHGIAVCIKWEFIISFAVP
jgi:hypothetical protein